MRVSRRSGVDPFIVMDVMEAARAAEAEGRDIVHMEVGQPGTPAPAAARRAAAAALERESLGYTVALGLPELRARIARHYAETAGLRIDPARVVVTAGSSGAFLLAFLALFDPGEAVVIGDPGYPSYRNTLGALGIEVRRVSTGPETRWQPGPGDLGDAAGLLVASPANPTGSVLSRDALAALAEACRDRGAALISDEIYQGLTYEGRAVSALEVWDEAVVVNSFSKYWSMTGWRIGWMVVPDGLIRTVERLAQNLFICPSHVGQVAALAAMDATEELEAMRRVYAENRAILAEALPRMGLTGFAPPDGAFYFWVDVSHLTEDSVALCRALLAEAGLAATPGPDFDPDRGRRWLRLSYAGTTEAISEGVRRLAAWLDGTPG